MCNIFYPIAGQRETASVESSAGRLREKRDGEVSGEQNSECCTLLWWSI